MAQNQNYIDQQKILQTDLMNWSDYITKVNNYIDVTNSNMTQISARLDELSQQITGLQNQINLINASIGEPSAYITVDPNSVYIEAYYNIPVSKKINIFSNKKVYVYASKTVSGLKFNGIDVSVQNARTTFCYIEGSALGSMITLKVDGAKQSNNVSLYFTDNNVWGSENVSVCLPVTIATTPQIIQTTSATTHVNMTTVI